MIRLRGVSKRFGRTVALGGASLEVAEGELFVLLGPSGCGKTTLLRLAAGLERPDGGTVEADGPVALVFQDLALFPHLDVAANVGFGLRRLDRGDREARIAGAIAAVRLDGLERRRPHELSGGEQQRVALARALATRPRTLLLDEPLGALDPDLREVVRDEVRWVHERSRAATILVTHDRDDAFRLADRIAVMRAGQMEQQGSPEEIYRRPRNRFVAAISGEAAFLPAGRGRLRIVRPEDVRLGEGDREAKIATRAFAPCGRWRYAIEFDGAVLVAYDARALEPGAAVRITLAPDLPSVAEEHPPISTPAPRPDA